MLRGNSKMSEYNRTPHPDISDPLEVRIRDVIKTIVYSTDFGINSLNQVKLIQKDYFTKALKNSDREGNIYADTQSVLERIAEVTNSKLVEGKDLLSNLPKGEPVFVAVNHFGINKLTTLTPDEIGLKTGDFQTSNGKPVKEIYPFTMYYAALEPVAKILNIGMSEAHLILPSKRLARLQEEAGLIVIPENKGEFQLITERTRALVNKHPNSLIIVFPEGETSGKRNQSHPYDLLPFHAGLWGIATELARDGLIIPVITAYQYWNPKTGFEVGVIAIDIPKSSDGREDIRNKAKIAHDKMQEALNRKLESRNITVT